ncbi:hypothetical protein SAMN02746041_03006 [Desulfacinum hydrothermale DSM 13146]|uniref:Uncharacterized protein n=1 Tax=Desulfacinum hydrothermale DSM 13146 TaxID=1121390 RepID=A0A1W1XUQ6_9BACT|nr:hypothetical protein [Desulfacinum hydrothermale]SMC27595.1 hypothetical protein SAMN02746041_03006 [Desulfacinum hydrothermale DSM 13146]
MSAIFSARQLRTCLAVFLLAWVLGPVWPAVSQEGVQTFYAQGVAPYNPDNPAQSQRNAIQDLLRQAVFQAIGTVLQPSQIQAHRAELEEKILASPDRYVQSYQPVSQAPEQELFRLQGSVLVDMKALSKDLEPWMPKPPEASIATNASTASEAGSAQTQSEPPPAAPVKDVVWAVAENWDGAWIFSQPGKSPGLLAPLIQDEASDYLWTLGYASLDPHIATDPSSPQLLQHVLDQARREGRRYVIVGTATTEGQELVARCSVYALPEGVRVGTVEQRVPAAAGRQEAALRLAALLVPSLDRVLGSTMPAEAPAAPHSTSPDGRWTITITGRHPYAAWLNLEALLAESAPELQAADLTLEPQSITVALDPHMVDQLAAADGMRVDDGHILRLKEYDASGQHLRFVLMPAPPSAADAASLEDSQRP